MKNRLPGRQEAFVFIVLSLICAAIVQVSGKYDVGLAVLSAPLFLVAALMGLRRASSPGSIPSAEPMVASTPDHYGPGATR